MSSMDEHERFGTDQPLPSGRVAEGPMGILDDGPHPSGFTAGGILDQFPDERFADENGDVPSFSPEPAPPGESEEEWSDRLAEDEAFDRALAAWQARHEGPDIVQDLPSWRADREADDADTDGAGL